MVIIFIGHSSPHQTLILPEIVKLIFFVQPDLLHGGFETRPTGW
jgi:hypothetical protein